jgi:hypothetical protein
VLRAIRLMFFIKRFLIVNKESVSSKTQDDDNIKKSFHIANFRDHMDIDDKCFRLQLTEKNRLNFHEKTWQHTIKHIKVF